MRRAKATLGSERQDLSRVVSICESSRSGKRERAISTFFTLLRITDSGKEGDPMGDPRRTKPSEVVGISGGRGLVAGEAPSGIYKRDLALFRWRYRAGPSPSMMVRAAWSSLAKPHRVPSSRYQALMTNPGTCSFIFSTRG